jgi:hypothetical protein
MIPQEELDRALQRWKARKLGHDVPTAVSDGESLSVAIESESPLSDEPTRVAAPHYQSQVETPPAEVHLSDADYEDETHR